MTAAHRQPPNDIPDAALLDGGVPIDPERQRDLVASTGVLMTPFGGRSMRPTLRRGDHVVWRRVTPETRLSVGDIVGYYDGLRFVAHRIIAVDAEDGWIVTRGDSRPRADMAIPPERVELRAVGGFRGGKVLDLSPPNRLHRWLWVLLAGTLRMGRLLRPARRGPAHP